MAVNRDIENDWEWFQPLSNGLEDQDEVIIVREVNGSKRAIRGGVSDVVNRARSGGWLYYRDSAATSGSPQALTADTRTSFTIDGLQGNTNTDFATTLPTDLWSNSTLQPQAVGEAYSLRIDFKVTPTEQANGQYIELDLDIGDGGGIIIFEQIFTYIRGQNNVHKFSAGFPIFCLDTFFANGGKFNVTSTVNANIFEKAIYISKGRLPHDRS